MNEDDTILLEFLEQVEFALSLRFREKWRYKYSTYFISIFQDRLLKSITDSKPIKKSTLVTLFTKKHKYDKSIVLEFFEDIDIELYYPVIATRT